MYEFGSRIRYSEVDSEGKLSLEALLDYFQDASTFHSEDIGLGVKYLEERHMAWVLAAWQIVVDRYPALCEPVITGTAPYAFRGFLGYRNFLMRTEKGEPLACANTLWTLMDMESMHPVKPTEAMLEGYVLEEKLPMDYEPRRIVLPAGEETVQEPVQVRRHHLDTNNHVNNGQYIRMAMEYLPEGFVIRQMRAEYKKQALLGDVIRPTVCADGEEVRTVSMSDTQGRPYCVVEFKRNNESVEKRND